MHALGLCNSGESTTAEDVARCLERIPDFDVGLENSIGRAKMLEIGFDWRDFFFSVLSVLQVVCSTCSRSRELVLEYHPAKPQRANPASLH